MTILSAIELKQHIETDLSDTALDRLAAAAESLIEDVLGPVSARTDDLIGRHQAIYTTAAVASVTTVKERDFIDDAAVTLSADDYRIQNGFRFIRLQDGTNGRREWAQHVEIIYAPEVDTGKIQAVQINLVKLDLNYQGARREKHGDVDFTHEDLDKAQKSALFPLSNSRNRMMIR